MAQGFTTLAAATGLVLGASVSASASLLDFTKSGALPTGSVGGVGYTVTGTPTAPNQDQEFDGDPSLVSVDLALENDGLGIDDDEITFSQEVIVTFDRRVRLSAIHFLDLFKAPDRSSEEVALISSVISGAPTLNFGALQAKEGANPGFVVGTPETPFIGKVFTFTAADSNDNFGDPDYALAGLDVDPSPIPVPAAGLLLLTGMGAVAATRLRRRR